MDLTTIEVTAGEDGWTRGDRAGGKDGEGFREQLAEAVGESAADGRDQGGVRVRGQTLLWRFTKAAAAKREAAARARVAKEVKANRRRAGGAIEWLASDAGQVELRAAGWKGIPLREVVDLADPPKVRTPASGETSGGTEAA